MIKTNYTALFRSQNEYHTPDNIKRVFWDKFFLGTRFYFYSKYLQVVFYSRKQSLADEYDDEKWIYSSQDILERVEQSGGKVHITGLENLHKLEGPVVFISNHMSALETQILPGIVAPFLRVTFVVKRSLVENKHFGPVMRSRNPIVVDRKNSRDDLMTVITQGQERLKDKMSVIVFPQSTRTLKLDKEQFNTLGVKLAKKANVKVVPIAVKTDFWGNGNKLKDFGPIRRKEPIHIHIGEPMEIAGSGKEENDFIFQFIEDKLKAWNKL